MKTLFQSFTTPILLFGLGTTLVAADPATDWVGLRGPNGTGVYPDSKPPTSWDLTTGKNVRWVVPLNGWGHGQPVIGGDRVFVLLETDALHEFPRLQCLDLVTGKVLWEDLIDHLPVAEPDDAKRAEIYKDLKLYNSSIHNGAVFEKEFLDSKTIEQRKEVAKKWADLGYLPVHRGSGSGHRVDGDTIKDMKSFADEQLKLELPNQDNIMKRLVPYGFWTDIYQTNCNFDCIGHVFGAPIWRESEKTVYVVTAGGTFAKYDLNGKRLWMTWSFNPTYGGMAGSATDVNARSPIIYKNLLIGTAANNLVAVDTTSGKIQFKGEMKEGKNSIASPVVLTVGKTDILFTAGSQAYVLPEGKKLKVEGWLISGMQALVKHDERDVVFFCGNGEHCAWPGKGLCDTPPPAAVRYTLDGDTLRGKVIWSGVQDDSAPGKAKGMGGTAPWLLYDHGKVFNPEGVILDALTGKTVFGKIVSSHIDPNRAVPSTVHLLQLANGNVYGWSFWNSSGLGVFTTDGKFVASNPFPDPHVTKEQRPIWHGVGSADDYFWFKTSDGQRKKNGKLTYSYQFTFGKDCLVARALMHLYCFSEGSQSAPQTTIPEKKNP